MVTVPVYESDVTLRPAGQSNFSVRASADAFGAATGRGLEQVGRGLGQMSGAVALVNETVVRRRRNDYAREKDALQLDPQSGFLQTEGKNALDGYSAYEQSLEKLRLKHGKNLTPAQQRLYAQAIEPLETDARRVGLIHNGKALKSFTVDELKAGAQSFANEALIHYSDPALSNKYIAAGQAEVRRQGELLGWGAETLRASEAEFVSGVHKNIALRMAQDDPIAADGYIKKHSANMSGAHQYELRTALETEIKSEQSKREADAILGMGRGSAAAAAGPRTVGAAGPTAVRSFLQSKSNKDASHIDGLDETFATNLAAMIQDAPPEIREGLGIYSGYRSSDRQAQLWADAVKKHGSEAAARKWVAPPGRSYHNHGQAVDLGFAGQSLSKAPADVVEWVHANASKYGLYFPMKHEPWHVEPMGTRGSAGGSGTVAPRTNTVSARAGLPAYDEMEARLAQIADPDVRDLTRKRLNSMIEARRGARAGGEG
jgi:hypothetical protein